MTMDAYSRRSLPMTLGRAEKLRQGFFDDLSRAALASITLTEGAAAVSGAAPTPGRPDGARRGELRRLEAAGGRSSCGDHADALAPSAGLGRGRHGPGRAPAPAPSQARRRRAQAAPPRRLSGVARRPRRGATGPPAPAP